VLTLSFYIPNVDLSFWLSIRYTISIKNLECLSSELRFTKSICIKTTRFCNRCERDYEPVLPDYPDGCYGGYEIGCMNPACARNLELF